METNKLTLNSIKQQLLVTKIFSCTFYLAQDCITPDGTGGNCINFRFCNFIVNLIIQNQQKRNEAIEAYIKKSICGYDGNDPKVCCPGLIFADTVTTTPATNQPGPFIFSAVNTPAPTSPQQTPGQPTFSPLQPTSNNPQNPTNPPNQPNPVIFGPVGSPSTQPPVVTPPATPAPPSGPITNRLPTFLTDKCGISTAVRSRIVG